MYTYYLPGCNLLDKTLPTDHVKSLCEIISRS